MEKTLVTDGQLGQLAVKQHELFERAKRGVYASFGEMLDTLQVVIEGKMPEAPTLVAEETFAAWRSFLIGGVAYQALLARVKSGYQVSSYAKDLMRQKAFTTLPAEERIDTIILTPADFGYEGMPTTIELLDPTRLAEWSRQNTHRLPEGCVVELLPTEAGPHIRDQYKDQPNGEVLRIAMERIVDSGRCPRVFTVDRNGDGEQCLYAFWAGPRDHWRRGSSLVFRLRKVV